MTSVTRRPQRRPPQARHSPQRGRSDGITLRPTRQLPLAEVAARSGVPASAPRSRCHTRDPALAGRSGLEAPAARRLRASDRPAYGDGSGSSLRSSSGGEGAWLAGSTAASLHGITRAPIGLPIRVLVPAAPQVRRIAWVDVRSTTCWASRVVERARCASDASPAPSSTQRLETPDERAARGVGDRGGPTPSRPARRPGALGRAGAVVVRRLRRFSPRSRTARGRCPRPTCSRWSGPRADCPRRWRTRSSPGPGGET